MIAVFTKQGDLEGEIGRFEADKIPAIGDGVRIADRLFSVNRLVWEFYGSSARHSVRVYLDEAI